MRTHQHTNDEHSYKPGQAHSAEKGIGQKAGEFAIDALDDLLDATLALGLKRRQGLTEVLQGRLPLDQSIRNTAIERICRVITAEQHHQIRDALDISAGAVLLVVVGAVMVGVLVLVRPLLSHAGI